MTKEKRGTVTFYVLYDFWYSLFMELIVRPLKYRLTNIITNIDFKTFVDNINPKVWSIEKHIESVSVWLGRIWTTVFTKPGNALPLSYRTSQPDPEFC